MAEDSIDLNLRARYDRRAGVFRLTAADPRLQGLPFQVTLSRGSESVDSLQELFLRESFIDSEDSIPSKPNLLKSSDYPRRVEEQDPVLPTLTSAVFIGPDSVGDALAKMRSDWEFRPHQPTIEAFERGLESGTLSNEISVVLIVDSLFDSRTESEAFADAIARLAPHALVAVISYNPQFRNEIVVKVAEHAHRRGFSSAPFYFVDPKRPMATLNEAVEDFLAGVKLAAGARSELRHSRLDGTSGVDELPSSNPRLNPINGAVVVGYSELMERLGVPAFDELGNRRTLTIDPNG